MAALAIPIARQEQSLSESTVILQVKFGLLGDSRKVSSSQVEVDTDKQLLRVAKKILVSNEFEAIKQIDRRVKKYLDSVCVPFETGTRFLAVPLIEDVDCKLREFERDRSELVDRFLDSYPTLCESMSERLRVTKQVKRKPGASPLLFGKFLMELGAFVSLEDISSELPSYREEVIGVNMDEPLAKAYTDLEEQIKEALEEHRGNHSVISTALNALLSYPDRPYGLGDLVGTEYDPELHRRVPFLIAKTQDLAQDLHYAKERKLIECIKADLARGRKCQIYAVYTAKRDVTSRLERVLSQEGIRVSVLTSQVPPDQREAWYERRLREGMQVCVAQLVEQDLASLFEEAQTEREIMFARKGVEKYDPYSDRQIWDVVQKLRSEILKEVLSPKDLKIPEWRLFSQPDPKKNSPNLRLRVESPPVKYAKWIEGVVLIDRLREVQALVGFSRLEAAGEDSRHSYTQWGNRPWLHN